MPQLHALQISSNAAGPVLSPQHKRFNTLLRQIDQARQALQAWREGIDQYRLAHLELLSPLEAEAQAARRNWVLLLDGLLGQRSWTKAERQTLRQLLCEAAGELLDSNEEDLELKALFDKHAEVDFDTERQQMTLAMKDLAEAMTGLDLGDDEGIRTDDDLFKRMQQEFQQAAAQSEDDAASAKPRRKASAAQKRREAAAQEATQSVRDVFRKLASALHPDRESDPAQREQKTSLMQKVNQAYAANDLLTLLELQLQIEQIDASHVANAGAQRLKHYNHVLAEQLRELKAEISQVEAAFCFEFGLAPHWGLNPRKLGQLLDEQRRELNAELAQQRHECLMFADTAATKRWLKRQRQLLREADEFDLDIF